jgi:hypothetical protein
MFPPPRMITSRRITKVVPSETHYTRSWWADFTRHGDSLLWPLVLNVLLAFVLAWRFERRRWVRIASVIFHTTLILLVIFIVVAMHFDLFPD